MLKKLLLSASLLSASSSALCVGFAEGTLIRTDGGPIPIEEIRVGDEVISCCGDACTIGKVSDVMESFEPTIQITTELNEVLVTALDQRFFVYPCWKKAKELKVNDFLETPEGSIRITDIKSGDHEALFTFEVGEYHNYYAYSTLVHNPYGKGSSPYGGNSGPFGPDNHFSGTSPSKAEPVEISDGTKQAAACLGKAAARGCVEGGIEAGALSKGNVPAIAAGCGLQAGIQVTSALVMGDCDPASGATGHEFMGPQYDFNQGVFDATGKLEANNHTGCTTVDDANNAANGIDAGNYGMVESVGNNTATSPAEGTSAVSY